MGSLELSGYVTVCDVCVVTVPVVPYRRRVDGYRGCGVRVGPMAAYRVCGVGHYRRVLVPPRAVV